MMYSKYYFEKYAQLTLKLTDNFSGYFKLSDKPDLQDIKNSIGIEVVNVEKQKEGIFRYLWNQYSGKGLSSDEFKDKLKKLEFQQKVISGLPFMAAEIRTCEARECIYEVIQTIQNKSRKFIDYKHFKQNGLYLFTNHIWEEQIQELHNKIQQNNFPFDFYILNIMTKLIVLTNAYIQKYDITNTQKNLFEKQAELYESNYNQS